MTREIKFRAWDKKEKKMLDLVGYALPLSNDTGEDSTTRQKVYMQFTGLHDKNGKEIYEGDIVKTSEGTYAVEYEAPEFQLAEYDHYGVNGEGFGNWVESEIIGNIYENPDF